MMEMEKIFGTQGILARHLPAYEPRPGQQQMAEAVMQLLEIDHDLPIYDEQEHLLADCLMVEAETGLGKTLAYLIPAVLSGRKVVISTNTRNLQDQILKHEIPFIRQYLDPDLKAMCVKGRQNYLCLYRWHQLTAGGQQELFADNEFAEINEWIASTTFADRTELSWMHGNSPLWQKLCCLSHFCLGSDCPDSSACFLNRLRREASNSRLLVVNHHLLFSDLAVRRNGYGEVLPRYESVIFDEAHHLEQVATTFFGFSFSRYQVLDLISDIEHSLNKNIHSTKQQQILSAARSLGGLTEQFSARFPLEKGRFPLAGILEEQPELEQAKNTILSALNALADELDSLKKQDEPWEQYMQRSLDLAGRLESITEQSFDDCNEEEHHYIHWFERTEKNLTLSATPVDIASELQETLFSTLGHCVFTSATLGINGSFTYVKKRLGIPEDGVTCSFPSPFDHANNCMLYIPDKPFPEPQDMGYRDKLHEQIRALLTISRGRALVLFTSFQAMDKAWHRLKDELDFPLLRQGTASRHELLTRFSRKTDSILFAVASFWEGVDVPGESLSLVIIDKLPFEVPSDPVIMARINRIKKAGGNPFFDFQVPRAILSLRQGVGRLMRRTADRGVMAVLDVRLFSKSYGRRFIKSLPPAPVSRDLQDVKIFFDLNSGLSKKGKAV
jgi:ATP-dependent DNA helicase DinG